jgi:pimeloyl-ACP methyl ester carboxylesterase
MLTACAAVVSLLAVAPAQALPVPQASGAPGAPSPPGGLPDDVPVAALRPAPTLPAPAAWPGPERFPRTAGTGRLAGGGYYWTDWIYDDHGAQGQPGLPGAPGADPAEQGVPSFGDYSYPPGPADNNGADIFRAGVFLEPTATVWRVDWNTLVDPSVPVAEWAFATGGSAASGSQWPAGAGVRSPGIDRALVVSSRGARLLDVRSGAVLARLPVDVDVGARSFVVRVPRRVLAPSGSWVVRLASGLADTSGDGFAPARGALPTEPAVYNVAFRTIAQEPPGDNFWNDDRQAAALTRGDVSAFSTTIRWADMAARHTTPEPAPTGWSDRWYVSSIEPGQGERTDVGALADGKPVYLGRVQPYAVYVPSRHDPTRPAPLTFLLHSLTQNHNQYAATTPKLSQQACEARQSICVGTLGRGPAGGFVNEAQLDFWEVWREVASAYRPDPERTVIGGYSMGGFGAGLLAEGHPDLFSRAILLAGAAGDTSSLDNVRWVPMYLAGGAADELVPVTDEIAEAQGLDRRGSRYRYLLYPAEDHVAFELQDGFSDAARFMGSDPRATRPGHVTFRWNDSGNSPGFGYGTTGAYWLRDLQARSAGPDALIDATSAADPDPSVTDLRTHDVLVPGDPTPAIVTQLDWQLGPHARPRPAIGLDLGNVGALSIRLADAGIGPRTTYTVDVTTDGPTTLTLVGPEGGARRVQIAAGHQHLVERSGT